MHPSPLRKTPVISKRQPVPDFWQKDISAVLITHRQIQRRVRALACQIEEDYTSSPLVIVPLLTGTVMFTGDLLRHITIPLKLDFMGVSSYRDHTTPGKLVFTKELKLDVKDANVLVVDDIIDTGNTLLQVTDLLQKLHPRSVKCCVLLDKKERRQVPIEADYVGFQIPDEFVVGYGLDYAEHYRNLPFVGVLKHQQAGYPLA